MRRRDDSAVLQLDGRRDRYGGRLLPGLHLGQQPHRRSDSTADSSRAPFLSCAPSLASAANHLETRPRTAATPASGMAVAPRAVLLRGDN